MGLNEFQHSATLEKGDWQTMVIDLSTNSGVVFFEDVDPTRTSGGIAFYRVVPKLQSCKVSEGRRTNGVALLVSL